MHNKINSKSQRKFCYICQARIYVVLIYKERDDDDTRGIYVQLGRTSGNRYTKEVIQIISSKGSYMYRKNDEGRIDLLRMHRGV